MTILAFGASGAFANGTGGVAVTTSTINTPVSTTGPASSGGALPTTPSANAAPVTAKTAKITYRGPVYERTATGEIVPFTPPASSAATTGTAASANPASATGGSAATSAEVAAGAAAATIPTELMSGDGMTTANGPVLRPELLVPGDTARYVDGLAAAPEGAPAAVQEIIWAADEVIGLPYIYGGGHNATFTSPGYDCSGTVSFALHGADLLPSPEDSSEFMGWGAAGVGTWVTIFSNPGHAYMTVAGLRLDTSSANDPSNLQGPRWRPLRPANAGFTIRHPVGL